MTSAADRPSKLNPIAGAAEVGRVRGACAPNSPLSSRTVNSSVSGGCGSLLLEQLGRERDEHGAAGAVVAAERRRSPVLTILRPCCFGFAPAHSGTVSMCVMNSSRG